MSVYKRDYDRETDPNAKGDEVWAYSFKFRKMRYRKSGFRTKRDAEFAEAKAREGAMWQGATPTVGGDIGFTALVEKFFETRHLIRAPRTIASETQKAKVLKKFFGNRRSPASPLAPLSSTGISVCTRGGALAQSTWSWCFCAASSSTR
jgi:hypothetical protein